MRERQFYNDKFQAIVFTLIAAFIVVIDVAVVKRAVQESSLEWVSVLLLLIAGVLFTIGLTSTLSSYKFIKANQTLNENGIKRVYANRDSLKSELNLTSLIENHDQVDLIGIKHSDFVMKSTEIFEAIERTNSKFRINVYFLSPSSDYKYLFEPIVYKRNDLDLGNEIKVSLVNLLGKVEKNREVSVKLKVFVYDCVPLGNITILDGVKSIVNHYQYFRKSTDAPWFELDPSGYSSVFVNYLEFLRTEGHCFEVTGVKKANLLEREYLSVLDKHGNPSGNILPRNEIHSSGQWHRSVHIWLIDEADEKVLFQKRGKLVEIDQGLWDISCAGHVSAGSDSLSTAVNEISEELGIVCSKDDLEYVSTIKKMKVYRNDYVDNEFNDVYILRKNLEISEFILDKDSVSQVKYFPIEKIKQLAIQPDAEFTQHQNEYKLLSDYLIKS